MELNEKQGGSFGLPDGTLARAALTWEAAQRVLSRTASFRLAEILCDGGARSARRRDMAAG